MSEDSGDTSATQLSRWQFSIGGMLIFTVSVAIGAAVAGSYVQSQQYVVFWDNINLQEGLAGGLMAVLIFWMNLGLLYQVRDLHSTLKRHPYLTSEQCWGIRFEIFSRLALISLFGIYLLVALLANHGIIRLIDKDVELWMGLETITNMIHWSFKSILRESVLFVLLIVLVGSVPYTRRSQRESPLRRWLWLIIFAVIVALYLNRLVNITLTMWICQIATRGIDYSASLELSRIDANIYNAHEARLFWGSLISTIFVAANFAILVHITRNKSMGIVKYFLWLAILFAGVSAVNNHLIWIYSHGIREISPSSAETCVDTPLYFWLSAIAILSVVAFVLAYRMVVERDAIPNAQLIVWRLNPNNYYHEWRSCIILLAISVVIFHLQTYPSLLVAFQRFYTWNDCISWWFLKPDNLLCICVIIVASHRSFARREDTDNTAAQLPSINPVRFFTIWITTAAVMISGAFAVMWMSFAFWFNPWMRGR